MTLDDSVDLATYPIDDAAFRAACRAEFDRHGVFVMPGFMRKPAINSIRQAGLAELDKVYAHTKKHTVYLSPIDPDFAEDHARNRLVTSSKGCLTDDQIAEDSALRQLYKCPVFREFLCAVLGETALYDYADPLSSINLHFAATGQELGWHFDNSSFAITLMIDPPDAGGAFEYLCNVRNADAGEMGFEAVNDVLDGRVPVERLHAAAGTLVLFRGRNSIHRVAPNEGARPRILAVLAYNAEPGVSLSEEARRTFYGRIG